jgi:hypothetical protein
LFVALSAYGDKAVTSPDGINWTSRTLSSIQFWECVAHGGGIYVALGSTSEGSVASTSTNGTTWTNRPFSSLIAFKAITYGNGLFVALGTEFGGVAKVYTSPTGVTWTARDLPESEYGIWNSVAYSGTRFVAVGEDSVAATSTNGTTWTEITMPFSAAWSSVAYGNGQFVAIAEGQGTTRATATSADGTTWVTRNMPIAADWSSIAYGSVPGVFVSVAQNTTSAAITTADTHYAYIDYSNIGRTLEVTNLSSLNGVVTMTSEDHGFAVGDYVVTFIQGKVFSNYKNNNQPVRIKSVTVNTFTYDSIAGYETGTQPSTAVEGYVVFAPQIEKTPVAMTRTYGEFPRNSDMGGLEFSTNDYSSTQYPNDTIRGSDLISVFEHLERYTSNKNGFDYRIDCSLADGVGDKKRFKRTFVLIPRTPETLQEYLDTLPGNELSPGTYAPPSAFGADQIVFEYPGNIQNVSFSENATNSATRVFVVGNNADIGGDASARYSASASADLLNDGWPLLDKVEKIEWPVKGVNAVNTDDWGNFDAERDLQLTAERFLRETKPPSGDIIISVNGSLNPEIGTFDPGDWCSVVIRDNFVQQRMLSNLEPRKDVIVRKIDGIRVSVPNSPAFPEMIDLTLITEWEVDKIGK